MALANAKALVDYGSETTSGTYCNDVTNWQQRTDVTTRAS